MTLAPPIIATFERSHAHSKCGLHCHISASGWHAVGSRPAIELPRFIQPLRRAQATPSGVPVDQSRHSSGHIASGNGTPNDGVGAAIQRDLSPTLTERGKGSGLSDWVCVWFFIILKLWAICEFIGSKFATEGFDYGSVGIMCYWTISMLMYVPTFCFNRKYLTFGWMIFFFYLRLGIKIHI